jgi:hypothetical protein
MSELKKQLEVHVANLLRDSVASREASRKLERDAVFMEEQAKALQKLIDAEYLRTTGGSR